MTSSNAVPASGRVAAAVGGLPTDWTEQAIGQFCTVKTGPFGTLLKASEYSEIDGVPVISVGEVREGYFRLTEHTPLVPESVQRRLPQYLLKAGDVVFGRKGAVDRSALVRQPQAGWFLGSDGIAVRPFGEHCPEYVAAQFQSFRVRQWLASNSTGTTMASMNQGVLSRVAIPFPPTIAEERSIAEVLNDADALIDSLEQLLTKKRQIKQGAMQELLTGKRRLPGFDGLVQTVQLGSVCKMQSGGTPAASQSAYFDGPHPWVAISDITQANKYLSTTERSLSDAGLNASAAQLFPAGTVLYAMYASVGECCIATVTSCTSQAILAMQPTKSLDSEYLYYSLVSSKAKAKSAVQQGTQGNLNKGIVQAMDIRLPEIAEQQAIARVLSEMDAEITALESRLTKARALKQAMAQALLTGRIRLPVDTTEPTP